MSDAEKRYPQIDKDALAVTYACERFSDLLIGMYFKTETDHKPFVALLGKQDLDVLPPRVQKFRMRFMRYYYTIVYVQGKEHASADALSGAPVDEEDPTLHEVSQAFVNQEIFEPAVIEPTAKWNSLTPKGRRNMPVTTQILYARMAQKRTRDTKTVSASVIRDNSPNLFATAGTTHHNTSGLTNGDVRKATRGTPRTGKMPSTCKSVSVVAWSGKPDRRADS